jgi:hypothetical protein
MRERFFGAFLTCKKPVVVVPCSALRSFVLRRDGLALKKCLPELLVCVCVCVLSVGDVTARDTFAILVSYADYGRGHAIRIGADSA